MCGLSVAQSRLIDRCYTSVSLLVNGALLLPRFVPALPDHRELAACKTLAIFCSTAREWARLGVLEPGGFLLLPLFIGRQFDARLTSLLA